MKNYIKNITNEKGFMPVGLAYRENGKVINIKPGEKIETKGDGSNLGDEKKLVFLKEEDKKIKNTKKEMI